MNLPRIWRRLLSSRATRNAAASYLAFASTAAWGLVSIPVAVAFLDRPQLGLWTVVNAFLGYLVWMDLGVGPATGRIMADAVAAGDQDEIDRWWTTTRAVLLSQAVIVLVVGLLAVPVLIKILAIPDELQGDALWLLVGGVIITALSLPMRGVPGLLTAQERFHWIPLLQAVLPWINLAVFFSLLRAGLGLRSYIYAFAASQAANWLCYNLLVITGPNRPSFNRHGLARSRFGKLFSLSGNMTVVGLIDTVLASLPTMIITRLGGLSNVPLYNFSWKGPLLASGLMARTYQAFYPALQRMHVTGQRDAFRDKHGQVGRLTVGISLIGAAVVLMGNSVLVQLLAGPAFYAGDSANIWFALAMITIPLSGYFRILLPISGSLGKNALVSVVKLSVGLGAGVLMWNTFGLSGLASVFTVLPLFNGIYGYYRGSISCGFKPNEISGDVALLGVGSLVLVSACGYAAKWFPGSVGTLHFHERVLDLPSLGALASCSAPLVLGGLLTLVTLRSFRK